MKILHICSIDNDMASGVAVIVPQYARKQAENNDVILYNINKNFYKQKEKFSVYNNVISIDEILQKNQIDIAVFHGIYFFSYLNIYKIILQKKIPYIIVPHCSLTEEAQKQKQFIKKILNTFFFNNFIENAVAIQYLSEIEKEDSDKFKNNSIIIPNGTDVDVEHWKKQQRDRFVLLYIGRYAIFQKGLDKLIDACALIKNEMLDKHIVLELYGKEFGSDLKKIEKKVEKNELSKVISINGSIYGEEKKKKLREADCFIQTSRFEGQPLAILETLAVGLVPIVTEGTTFSSFVTEHNCGFDAGNSVESIADAIMLAYEKKNKLEEMSENAVNAVERMYSWPVVTEWTLTEYKKIIDYR